MNRPRPLPIGGKFGRWTLVADKGFTDGKHRYMEVRCDCGVEKVIPWVNLRNGSSRSCGCGRKDRSQTKGRQQANRRRFMGPAWGGDDLRWIKPAAELEAFLQKKGRATLVAMEQWARDGQISNWWLINLLAYLENKERVCWNEEKRVWVLCAAAGSLGRTG